MFMLNRGAHIDTRNSRGQTALSIIVENRNPELTRMLLNRGVDPLIALESRNNLSVLEQLIRLFIRHKHDMTYLDML
jgi:ankyrin repeat protein